MATTLEQFAEDHRTLLEAVGAGAGMADPVAVDLDEFETPLLKAARKGELLPIHGALVRDWNPHSRRTEPGIELGMRVYRIEGVRFVCVRFFFDHYMEQAALQFTAVERRDYQRLYRIAQRCHREQSPVSPPPVLPADQYDLLWKNTIGYLEERNLERIRAYGGRARRGVLLSGPPGNGKTMACRWIWQECRDRNWEWKMVTPDAYRSARGCDDGGESLRDLFSVERRGVIFFDDMDLALRDRETVHETDDQSVFLTSLDGIAVKEGVVFLFTTNCAMDLIDRAFKRPGRIDVTMQFKPPTASLRRQLIERWHAEIVAPLDLDAAVRATDGFSFAELDEVKTLLIMRFMDEGRWEWDWAIRQFALNREGLTNSNRRRVGFDGITATRLAVNGSVV